MVSAARWQRAPHDERPDRASSVGGSSVGGWDLLLLCVAVYIATAVGRIHDLFPMLLPFKPALLAAALAIVLYLIDRSGRRAPGRLRSTTTSCLLGLLLWSALSVPAALNQGVAF